MLEAGCDMAEFLNSYCLPEELMSAVGTSKSALAYSSGIPSCGADTSDCSTDGACSSDCSSDGGSFCNTDTSDCSTDGSCGSDGVCSRDSCSSDGVCSDVPSVTRPTDTGSLSVVSVTSNSVTIRLTKISRADYYEIAYRPTTTYSAAYVKTFSLSYTITGLSPNTTYVINYRGANSAGDGPFMSSGVTTTTLSDFTPFDWTYAGLDADGNPVAGSVKRAGLGIYVTAAEWNELARLVSSATGKSVSTVSRGLPISGTVVNTMARALGVGTVTADSTEISAAFFNNLRAAYNALG